jgi:hypothetical protein
VSVKPDPNWTPPVADARSFEDARANLEHTLQVFGDLPDDAWALMATGNVYGPNVRTGLTWRDLRLIADGIGAATR